MNQGEKNLILNLYRLNKDEPLTAYLFKKKSRLSNLVNTWMIVFIIFGMTYICGKIALEGLSPFMLKMLH